MSKQNNPVNAELMVQHLTQKIAKLSQESAANYALAVSYKKELDELKGKKNAK
ncbi:zinc ABC transporter substrate-binding protein [Halobacillus aidingensis]|uniref:Uncharacterized protein n=1 Tax=Halobacillus aidingensis TaxID=240303 RepID=A0A1H0MEE2_HALAD|nr:zinc ABC transporter substrate-binding protein [Halobacillus aidingensis]SDO78737.1 hypothetical protein SAMN05421677_1089 [Halobacillus aidingensis]